VTSFKDICNELGSLSLNELQEIRKRVEVQIKFKNVKSSSTDWVEEILIQACSRYIKPIPIETLRKYNPNHLGTKLTKIANEVLELASYLQFNQQKTAKLCSVIIEAAYLKLKAKNLPQAFQPLLLVIVNVSSLLEDSYPGYLAGGLFNLILDS
jgi:hypothetical protein